MCARFRSLAHGLLLVISAPLAVISMPSQAESRIAQLAEVEYEDPLGFVLRNSDLACKNTTDPICERPSLTVLAQIAGPSFGSAFASAGEFGNVGLQARQTEGGTLSTHVAVASDENVNVFSVPQRAQANFVIDGGSLLLDGIGSIAYTIEIQDLRDNVLWTTGGTLEVPGSGATSLSITGTDIGATLSGRTVLIPLTFVTLDLGIVPAGGRVGLRYDAVFRSDVFPVRLELAAWGFSDPGNVEGAGDFPTITLTSVNAVPQPPTGLLLLCAVITAIAIRYGRRRLVSIP